MAFTLPALPYALDALEPHIDATTMGIHHGIIIRRMSPISTLRSARRRNSRRCQSKRCSPI